MVSQNGDMFGFGDYDKSSPKLLLTKDIKVLNQTPSSNMSAERLVGSVNYELGVRGPHLELAGSSIVKAKSMDLIELKPVDAFQECRKTVQKVNTVVKAWTSNQDSLVEEKMTVKLVENSKVDTRKNNDLSTLKKVHGPFTSSDEVNAYVNDDSISEEIKTDRLYTKVQ